MTLTNTHHCLARALNFLKIRQLVLKPEKVIMEFTVAFREGDRWRSTSHDLQQETKMPFQKAVSLLIDIIVIKFRKTDTTNDQDKTIWEPFNIQGV